MKTNVKVKKKPVYTHGGAVASNINAQLELRRSIMTCMLWENAHYESGVSIADRIKSLIPHVKKEVVFKMAVEAREKMKLRHVPLLIAREMARIDSHKSVVADLLEKIIQRPDELSEFLSIYWKEERQTLSAQVKKGLARAFNKFSGFQLAKYNRDGAVKLRDVLFLSHAKPKDSKQKKDWDKLVNNKLESPDTWEVELSSGANKKDTFERLITEEKLGAMALMRNLRGMLEAGVDEKIIKQGLKNMNTERVLPFRFITAARHAPRFEQQLEIGMLKCLENQERLMGKTVLVIDVSGSMQSRISGKSEESRVSVASAITILCREICEEVQIYATAGSDYSRIHATALLPARRGFALRDTVGQAMHQLGGGGIFLTQCMEAIETKEKDVDRVIVFTDEQDCDHKLNPSKAPLIGKHNYIVNVAAEKNGIGYGKWTKIDGWSEAVIDYIIQSERED